MYYQDIEGGKIKSLKQIGKDMSKGFKKTIAVPLKKKVGRPVNKAVIKPGLRNLGEMGTQVGQFTNKELLPGAVTVGIPLASAMVGTLGAMAGIPPQLTMPLTEELLKEYIPDQYQSKNKYVNMFADLPTMALTGDFDQEQLENMGKEFTSTLYSDITKPKKVRRQSATTYNPEYPYQDLMEQTMNKYQIPIQQLYQQTPEVEEQPEEPEEQDIDDYDNTSYSQTYTQKTGSANALLGAGIKKKSKKKPKKKPKKEIIEELEIYTKTKPTYKKFQHAKNSSLEQLLEATKNKKDKDYQNKLNDISDKQLRLLEALGY
jgi:hypothetical protein